MEKYKVNFEGDAPRMYVECKKIDGDLNNGKLLAIGYRDIQEILAEEIGG